MAFITHKKLNIKTIVEYIFILIVIIECNTVYLEYIPRVFLYGVGVVLLAILILFEKKNFMVMPRFLGGYMLFFLYALIPFVYIQHEFIKKQYISYFFLILPLFYFYFIYSKNKLQLFLRFSDVMVLISLFSFALWVLCSVVKIVPLEQRALSTWGGLHLIPSFHYIYFETQNNLFLGMPLVRNSAIFSEAPMYGICVATAFTIELLLRQDFSKIKSISLFLGIISSTSITAIILALLTLVVQKRIKIRNVFLRSCMYIIIAIGVSYTISILVADKKENNEISYNDRNYRLEQGFKVFESHPILGKGFLSESAGNSNSITTLLSEVGLYVGLLFLGSLLLIPLYLIIKDRKYYLLSYTWILFFIGYCVTIITYKFVTMMFVMYMFSRAYRSYNNQIK